MLTLKLLQNRVQHYLMNYDEAVFPDITQPQHDTVKARLDIYANAYRYRLIDILKADFITLCILLGDKPFEKIAMEYIDSFPSHYFTVRYFGSHFIDFLKKHPLSKKKPFITDMATFEWALVNIADTIDAPIVSLHDLTVFPQEEWGRLQFSEHPSLQLITLNSNVPAIWQANAEKKKLPKLKYTEQTRWRLWRQGVQSYYCSQSEAEALACSLMCQQKSFAEICERLCEYIPENEVPQIAAEYLLRWLNEGILSSVKLAPLIN